MDKDVEMSKKVNDTIQSFPTNDRGELWNSFLEIRYEKELARKEKQVSPKIH